MVSIFNRSWRYPVMTVPGPGQTVHMMNWLGVLRVRRDTRRREGRNARELALYTTDDLRHLYQQSGDDLIRLRDGIVNRAQLVAEIRWRDLRAQAESLLLVIAAVASVIAAVEGWK
jgi:hypothetical protein